LLAGEYERYFSEGTAMGRIALSLAAATLLLGCVACATAPQQSASRLTQENLARIIAHKSTANEVRELLGPPSRTMWSRADQAELWGYNYRRDYEARTVWVEYSADMVVRNVSDSTDFDNDPRYTGP
jgi:hypothetical protein